MLKEINEISGEAIEQIKQSIKENPCASGGGAIGAGVGAAVGGPFGAAAGGAAGGYLGSTIDKVLKEEKN